MRAAGAPPRTGAEREREHILCSTHAEQACKSRATFPALAYGRTWLCAFTRRRLRPPSTRVVAWHTACDALAQPATCIARDHRASEGDVPL